MSKAKGKGTPAAPVPAGPDGQALVAAALASGYEMREDNEAVLLELCAGFRTLYHGLTTGACPLPEHIATAITVNHALSVLNDSMIGDDPDDDEQ